MLVLEVLVGLHRTLELQLLQHCWGIDLNYCDVEGLPLEMNRDYSVIFEIAPKYSISDSLSMMRATPFLLRDSCPQ